MKIKRLLLIFLLNTFFYDCYGQKILEFYQLYYQAAELKNKSNYGEAQKKYLQALSINPKDTYFYVDLISVMLHRNKDKKAKKYLKNGILRGTSLSQLKTDILIREKFKTDSTWTKLYDVYRQKYNSSIPYQEVKLKLMILIQKDQEVRNLMRFFNKDQRDSIINAQDIQISKQVYEIVDKIGFPDREKVGEDASGAMYILLSHLLNNGIRDKEELDYFEPLIRSAVLKGTFEPFYMAILVDRSRVLRGLDQMYGSYWQINSSGKRVVTPIIDIEAVDERRYEIGLPPLNTVKGLVFPINYKEN